MTGLVNWCELRKIALLSTHRNDSCNTSYWDKKAVNFNENMTPLNELTMDQLSRLQLLPEYTVLDVGAGNGRITIPVAKVVKQVTAVEPSVNMLALLKANAEKEQATNILYVNKPWEELTLDGDFFPHDVVIASLSLLMVDIEPALLKIDAAAKRHVYIFLSASNWMDEEMQKISCGDSIPVGSDYIYVYNILHDLGVLANVEIWNYESKQSYNGLNDAVSKFMELYSILPKKEGEIREYLRRILVADKGKLWLKRNRKMAMIWWTKN